MWTWQLAILALVAPLALPVTAAPKPAIAGSPSLGTQFNQFSAFDQYDPQLYNQRDYDYSYNAVPYNSALYGNGYYNGAATYGDNYENPSAYDYNRYNDQTNSYSGKQDSYSGKQYSNSGKQDRYSGKQDSYSGKQYSNSGKQDRYSGKQDSYSGKQYSNSGKQDSYSGKQDSYSGKQDNYSGKQDSYSGKQDSYSGKQDSYSGKQDSYSAKSYKPVKADSSSDGKYDPKKYNTGQYDAKLYNTGKHNARNYDTGLYDHAKYGTKPVNIAKLRQAPGSQAFRAKSVGAESRLGGNLPGTTGYFIRGDGNGAFDWGQYGHDGKGTNFGTKKSGFAQNGSSFLGKKSSTLKKDSVHKVQEYVKKDSVENDFDFNTKQVFSKIDVFGPNHKQLFTGGKRVYNGGQGPRPSPIKLSDPRPADGREESANGSDTYGFYADLSNLYSDKSLDEFAAPPAVNGKGTDEFGKDIDSYGYYSDVSNLYADSEHGGKASVDKSFNHKQSPNNLNFNTKASTVPMFRPAISPSPVQGTGSFDSLDRQSPLDVAEGSDSYGFYSELSNLYGSKPWKPLDSEARLDATATFQDFDAGLSENQLDFDNQQEPARGKFTQDVPPNDAGFDSYGFYSNLDNLYRPEKPEEFPVKKSAAKNSHVAAGLDRMSSFGDLNAGLNGLDFNSQGTKAGGKFKQNMPSNDLGFDSYGFYSDPDNLYGVDASQGTPQESVTRGQSQLTAGSGRRRVQNKAQADRDRQLKAAPVDRDRASKNRFLEKIGSRERDSTRSQNGVEFDSYGFYSDPLNLYA